MNDTPDEASNLGASEHIDSASAAADTHHIAELSQALEATRAENADLRDRLLRLAAEMENYRRRAEREKEDVSKYAVSKFARDMVGIADNLHRAIEAVGKDALQQNPAFKTVIIGVEATERELLKVLEQHNIIRIDPLGEKFDPHQHEAMTRVDVADTEANVIVQVLTAGYRIHDRMLRPASVIVATGNYVPVETKPAEAPASNPILDLVPDPEVTPLHRPHKTQAADNKRPSIVTKPITESSQPIEKDDLISSLGKRLEGGN